MSVALIADRPGALVDDYHVKALRWWHGKVGEHRPAVCRCLPCADLRRYLGWPPLPIFIGSRVLPALSPEATP